MTAAAVASIGVLTLLGSLRVVVACRLGLNPPPPSPAPTGRPPPRLLPSARPFLNPAKTAGGRCVLSEYLTGSALTSRLSAGPVPQAEATVSTVERPHWHVPGPVPGPRHTRRAH
jgi:hypothetical protein